MPENSRVGVGEGYRIDIGTEAGAWVPGEVDKKRQNLERIHLLRALSGYAS